MTDPAKPSGPATRDMFAEMYVAAMLADAGWELYFPRRDRGFDMIALKRVEDGNLIRPIQVKGKYPEAGTGDRAAYGYVGRINGWHDDMVLALPFFDQDGSASPSHIAWMPRASLLSCARGYRCQPARLIGGVVSPKPGSTIYFGREGLDRIGIAWPC